MAKHFVKRTANRTFHGFEKEKELSWNGPFSFIHGADTQFGMIDAWLKKLPDPGWEEEIELTKKAIEAINLLTPRPLFFVVCGDLIHAKPGADLRFAQEEDFMRLFAELNPDIPLVCVCGNHDIGNHPTPETVLDYREKFSDDYFTFYCAGVMFIVLNSQFYEDPGFVSDLAKEQEVWLEEQLAEAKTGKYKHVIVFQHIPWFTKTVDEEKTIFNLPIDLRQPMLEKFLDANIRYIFCGHYHQNSGGFYKDMELVVTSAIGCQCGPDKSGLRVVKVLEDSVKHDYYDLDEIPKTINL